NNGGNGLVDYSSTECLIYYRYVSIKNSFSSFSEMEKRPVSGSFIQRRQAFLHNISSGSYKSELPFTQGKMKDFRY
ncbi:MAG: hypothetical protein ACJ71L_05880, partial [Nitrososphaeraceae archaeon]